MNSMRTPAAALLVFVVACSSTPAGTGDGGATGGGSDSGGGGSDSGGGGGGSDGGGGATLPGAPTGVAATRGDRRAIITWSAPVDVGSSPLTGYQVLSADAGVSAGSDCTAPSCSAELPGLVNGQTYRFAVRAFSEAGLGPPSLLSNEVVPAGVPLAPSSIAVTPLDTQLDLAWDAAPDNGEPLVGHALEVFLAAGSGGCPASGAACATGRIDPSTCTASPCQARLGGLTNGLSYRIEVRGENRLGAGSPSPLSAQATPNLQPGAPSPPAGAAAAGGVESAELAWTAPLDPGTSPVAGYAIAVSPGGATRQSSCTAATCALNFAPLPGGASYTFSIAALNDAGVSGPLTTNATPVVGRPQPPTSVTAAPGDGQASVAWTAPANTGGVALTRYTVTSASGCDPTPHSVSTAGPSPAASVGGLGNGCAYTFTVVAENVHGASAPSAASDPVTPAGVPSAPTGVSAVRGDGSAAVAWTAGSPNGSAITGASVQVYAVSSPATCTNPVEVSAVSSSCTGACTAAVSGLTNGSSYCFAVSSTNGVGTGAPSALVGPVTPAATPGSPTAVSISSTPGTGASLRAAFSPPLSSGGSGLTGYRVDACSVSTFACGGPGSCTGGSLVTFATGGVSPIDVSPLPTCNYQAATRSQACSTAYRLCVYATNALGPGPGALTTAAKPQVSYLIDNLRGIWGGRGCTGCHAGHTVNLDTTNNGDYTSVVAVGTLIYACPESGTGGGFCMGGGYWTSSDAEGVTLRQWIDDGQRL